MLGERAAAVRAAARVRFDEVIHAREMLGQLLAPHRLAFWGFTGRALRGGGHLSLGRKDSRLELLEAHCQLSGALELLAGSPEAGPPELGEQEPKMLDQHPLLAQLDVLRGRCGMVLEK